MNLQIYQGSHPCSESQLSVHSSVARSVASNSSFSRPRVPSHHQQYQQAQQSPTMFTNPLAHAKNYSQSATLQTVQNPTGQYVRNSRLKSPQKLRPTSGNSNPSGYSDSLQTVDWKLSSESSFVSNAASKSYDSQSAHLHGTSKANNHNVSGGSSGHSGGHGYSGAKNANYKSASTLRTTAPHSIANSGSVSSFEQSTRESFGGHAGYNVNVYYVLLQFCSATKTKSQIITTQITGIVPHPNLPPPVMQTSIPKEVFSTETDQTSTRKHPIPSSPLSSLR